LRQISDNYRLDRAFWL